MSKTNSSTRLFGVLVIMYGFVFLHRQSIVPFLAELTVRFDTGYAGAGGLMSAIYIAYAASLLPAGFLADRFSNRTLIVTGVTGVGLGTIMLALAPSYSYAVASRILTGMSVALAHCPAIRQIAGLAPPGRRGVAMAVREVSIALAMIGVLAGLPWLARFLAFERMFLLISLPLFAMAAILAATSASRFVQPVPSATGALWNIQLSFLAPIGFLTFMAANGLIGWLPTLLRLHHGLEATTAGLVMSGIMIIMIPCTLGAAYLSDRSGLRSPIVALGCLALLCGLPGWLAVGQPLLLALAVVMTGVGWGATAALVIVMAAEAGGQRSGWSVGIVMTVAQGASALSAYVLGWLLDLTGGFAGQVVFLACAVVASGIICLAGWKWIGRLHRDDAVTG